MNERFPRRIYLLSPKDLSPETIAVTFAKTSRSPQSFREIAQELSDDAAADFHEKWVIGYGHASVAEHAVLHIAFENVSRLAVECIESNRLASYTEKSTRYLRWDPEGFYTPSEVIGTQWEEVYQTSCRQSFQAYHNALEPARGVIQKRYPRRRTDESEARWDNRIRSRYVDNCRFLLPAASLANVGMTVNARALEHAIRKMLSHPLAEVQAIGAMVKEAAQAEVPTLVKYADEIPYLMKAQAKLVEVAAQIQSSETATDLRLIDCDPEAETRVIAAAIFERGNSSFQDAFNDVQAMPTEARRALVEKLLGSLGRFDIPPRALEHAAYTFEATLDQGAYFELKRHRLMTQTPQPLTTELGYAVPRLLEDAKLGGAYREAMDIVAEAYRALADWNPHVASYVVPNGYNRRILMTLNLRELYHLCELRSQPNAHFSIRRLALKMAEMVREIHPTLSAFMRLPEGVDWRSIEAEFFTQL
jgi:thymidylate synthase ThyX